MYAQYCLAYKFLIYIITLIDICFKITSVYQFKNKRQLILLSIVVTLCTIICSNVSYMLQLLKQNQKNKKSEHVIKACNFTAKEFKKSRFSRLPSINQHQIYLYFLHCFTIIPSLQSKNKDQLVLCENEKFVFCNISNLSFIHSLFFNFT